MSLRDIAIAAAAGALLAACACSRRADDASRRAGDPWFTDITEAAGLDFVHESGASGDRHLPEIMGSGATVFDADGEGDLDVYRNDAPRKGSWLAVRAIDPRLGRVGRLRQRLRGSGRRWRAILPLCRIHTGQLRWPMAPQNGPHPSGCHGQARH